MLFQIWWNTFLKFRYIYIKKKSSFYVYRQELNWCEGKIILSIKLAIFNEGKINVLIDKEAVKRRQVNFERRQRIDKRIIKKKKKRYRKQTWPTGWKWKVPYSIQISSYRYTHCLLVLHIRDAISAHLFLFFFFFLNEIFKRNPFLIFSSFT